MPTSERDDCVYQAETWVFLPYRQFISAEDAQAYINEILASRWWKRRCAVPEVRLSYAIHKHQSQAWVKEGLGYVDISRGFLNEPWVLHELAHIKAPSTGHGPEFLKFYLALVRWKMGTWYAKRLREEFREQGIRA
jgi:putative metallohydrolase (TIGR04338 family)